MIDFSAITLMNKVIKADDVDFIGVEIGALVKKCAGITSDMLFALLLLRGDITKADFKEACQHTCHSYHVMCSLVL